MRRPVSLLVALGGLAALAFLGRKRTPAVAAPVAAGPDPRADELRRKLAESRSLVDEREEFEQAETPIDRAEDVDDKRRRVHERGRATAERMRRPPDAG